MMSAVDPRQLVERVTVWAGAPYTVGTRHVSETCWPLGPGVQVRTQYLMLMFQPG